MPGRLLETKFHQPALPPNRVLRPQLLRSLTEGLNAGRQLTLISAPAGFGKTCCASEWLSTLDLAASWLSLDQADDDPVRFFTYFMTALQKIAPSLGEEIASILQAGQLPPREVTASVLINDMQRLPDRFVLALDDFHLVQDRAIVEVVESILNNQPPQLHLLLVTREDPSLPLARLRANNQLTEIRAGDLRFSSQEVDHFFNDLMGLSLSATELTKLEVRTEGWIAGMQLAGLSMRGRTDLGGFIASLSGGHRYILSYLTEEVLNQQRAEIQEFLLHTSILDKLSGDLCRAVTGRADSHALLEQLYHANLFLIPLDDVGHWYRYHHLFADLLRTLQSRLDSGQIASLHSRASRWYVQAGMAAEAIEHALAAADYAQTVDLLEQHAMALLSHGYARMMERWMQAIPAEWHLHSPRANLAFAWMHLLRGNYRQVDPYLERVETALAQSRQPETLQAEMLVLRSNLLHVQGQAAESIPLATQALEITQPDNYYIRGLAYLGLGGAYRQTGDYAASLEAYLQAIQDSHAAGNLVAETIAVSALTIMANQHGQLHFAHEVGYQALERLERRGIRTPPMMGGVHGALGIVYYEWNRLVEARQHFEEAMYLSNLGGHNASLIYVRLAMARLHQAEGDMEAAVQATQAAADLLPFGAPTWLKPEVAAQQVRLYLALNNPLAARAILSQHGLDNLETGPPPTIIQAEELLFISYLRLMLHQAQVQFQKQDLRAGIELADRLITSASDGRRLGITLQAWLLKAQLSMVHGDAQTSLEAVRQALMLAEPQSFIRGFADEGPLMAALLQRYQTHKPPRDPQHARYLQTLLGACAAQTPSAASEPPVIASVATTPTGSGTLDEFYALIEPLTERELEVLQLIAAGLKYEDIAAQLVISLNTVRYHVKGIYSKLNVNSRSQAVAAARQVKLI